MSSESPPHPPVLNNRQYKTGWNSMELYIIQTGITCKKISFYMHDSDCRWFIVKTLKKFEVMLNEFSYVKEIIES